MSSNVQKVGGNGFLDRFWSPILNLTPGFFRFLLATLVVVYHSVDFITIGHFAVYVFFILSGYWIFKMYNEKYSHFKYSIYVYTISRLFRIMPIYWIILIFTALIFILVPEMRGRIFSYSDTSQIIISNCIVLGLGFCPFRFVGSAWSLDIEVQFYLLTPLLVYLYKHKIIAIALMISSGISCLYLIYSHNPSVQYNTVFLYLIYFLIGGCIYKFDIAFNSSTVKWTVLIMIIIIISNYVVPNLRAQYYLDKSALIFGYNYTEFLSVLLTFLSIPFVTKNVRLRVENRNTDSILSSMSYTMYLIHWPLLFLYSISVRNLGISQKFIHLILFYAATLILSYLFTRYVDSYFESKRKKWISNQTLNTFS